MKKFLFRIKVIGACLYFILLLWLPPVDAFIKNLPLFKSLVAEDTREGYRILLRGVRFAGRAFIKGEQLTFKEQPK